MNILEKEGAWCWFADPRAISYKGRTFIGCIDVHGNIKAIMLHEGKKTEVLVRSNFQPDDHDNPTFLVLPDERIMIIYSRHTDEACFYYRISKNKCDITDLGEEKVLKTDHNTTYPSLFIMENDPCHIYLCYRGVNWHPTCARLTMPDENDNISFDVEPFQIVKSTVQGIGCRPYAKYVSDGKSKIHMVYSATHPDNVCPVCIYYSCLDTKDFTLYD
ncbi:MAG: BNR-4 repeat-containing protein, partial [Clostridia bacterium]|nr:BNR-4 repeat-containing protein [Clostridia bacterium]